MKTFFLASAAFLNYSGRLLLHPICPPRPPSAKLQSQRHPTTGPDFMWAPTSAEDGRTAA